MPYICSVFYISPLTQLGCSGPAQWQWPSGMAVGEVSNQARQVGNQQVVSGAGAQDKKTSKFELI